MKTVCLVNGSLSGARASSLSFLKRLSAEMTPALFHVDWGRVSPWAGGTRETLAAMSAADAIVLAFPLFSYSLPGAFTALLEDFHAFAANGGPYSRQAKVFAIVNCGFPEESTPASERTLLPSWSRATGSDASSTVTRAFSS